MKETNEGTVFIVDISGYSRFIKEIDHFNGMAIITRLFNGIIEENHLGFKISEIEGDAILFYRFGKPVSVPRILLQFKSMLLRFQRELQKQVREFSILASLSLKAIVHYGDLEEFAVNRFYKLYGNTLVDAHRLLKNSVPLDTYVLITKEYLNKTHEDPDGVPSCGFSQCEIYDVGNLCYTYYPFESRSRSKQAMSMG
jgi:hypothetical protein